MTFGEFVDLAERNWRLNKRSDLRRGQSYFNVLADVVPELAERIRGGDNDPFYVSDAELGKFLGFASERWEDFQR